VTIWETTGYCSFGSIYAALLLEMLVRRFVVVFIVEFNS
jgi:hypothetical protein